MAAKAEIVIARVCATPSYSSISAAKGKRQIETQSIQVEHAFEVISWPAFTELDRLKLSAVSFQRPSRFRTVES
ncbi:MAG: hypothetical protein ACK5Q5_17575 [Planctomycetaceae bacterium]